MRRLRTEWRRWKHCRDICEVCGTRLRWPTKTVEVFAMAASDEFGPMAGGGVSATFCAKHAPSHTEPSVRMGR